MQFICHHDPADPNHLICETKLPWRHRVFEIGIGIGALIMVVVSVVFFVKGRGVDKGRVGGEAYFDAQTATPVAIPNPNGEKKEGGHQSQQYSGQISLSSTESSAPYLEAEVLYFSKEGEQVGRGPWPPKTGETTKVMVFWKISPLGGGSPPPRGEDVVISGKLDPNAQWTGFAPMGAGLTYESATRAVRFIPREGNTAVFEVAITPTPAQLQEKQLVVMTDLQLVLAGRRILSPNLLINW